MDEGRMEGSVIAGWQPTDGLLLTLTSSVLILAVGLSDAATGIVAVGRSKTAAHCSNAKGARGALGSSTGWRQTMSTGKSVQQGKSLIRCCIIEGPSCIHAAAGLFYCNIASTT